MPFFVEAKGKGYAGAIQQNKTERRMKLGAWSGVTSKKSTARSRRQVHKNTQSNGKKAAVKLFGKLIFLHLTEHSIAYFHWVAQEHRQKAPGVQTEREPSSEVEILNYLYSVHCVMFIRFFARFLALYFTLLSCHFRFLHFGYFLYPVVRKIKGIS